ncbi:MAG: thermonuclease family protein, partial [Planctomycetota bacterium]|nr:thermonuclease family protein [Planctomycetota bacterium]
EGGMYVRLCGVTVPSAGNKIPSGPVMRTNDTARDTVKAMIEGKVVKLQADKFSKMTLDGMALVFVEHDGKDLGTELLTSGVVRKHPKHGHMKRTAYGKAESAGRTAKAGCWAK